MFNFLIEKMSVIVCRIVINRFPRPEIQLNAKQYL